MDLSHLFKTDEQLDAEYGKDERTGFDAIETGWYEVVCTKAEEKDTKKGDTKLVLELKILGPKFVNRLIWPDFWSKHSNKKAEGIGNRQINEIMQAAGGTPELIGAKFEQRIIFKEAGDDIFVADNGKRYFEYCLLDDNNNYNTFGGARPIQGEPAPDFVKKDKSVKEDPKDSDDSSAPWLKQ